MSVLGFGYVVNNKARVALERALSNPREPVLGVEWESILTFGFTTQGMGVGERKALAEGRSRQTCLAPFLTMHVGGQQRYRLNVPRH